MKLLSCLASLALFLPFAACKGPDYGRPLPEGAPALLKLSAKEPRPDFSEGFEHRDQLLIPLERSIEWFGKPSSQTFFPMEGVSFERARDSVVRFKELLLQSKSAEEFTHRLDLEFTIYKSAGWNAKGGGLLYTAYCTPIFEGSRTKDATYQYPLYAMPPDLVKGEKGAILGRRTASGSVEPYPARREIEASALLEGKNLELVYLMDPLDVFIAQVNGSAVIETSSGEQLKFGYSAKNGREYSSLGKELIRAKELKAKDMSLSKIREWGRANPEKLRGYMARNDSYVFFTEIDGNPCGSLGFQVEGDRSLATDKTLFPRGGVVFVDTPKQAKSWYWPWEAKPIVRSPPYRRFMLDQDTGGAIRTAGRADLYFGIGPEAEQRAGNTMAEGQLYYFFLNESEEPRAIP
ncbi:MAG TPA: MltA domain-containing protein [Planctomycetota bacterium]|nr:MltA domain-containing protein [Planctomycetota bacterium]